MPARPVALGTTTPRAAHPRPFRGSEAQPASSASAGTSMCSSALTAAASQFASASATRPPSARKSVARTAGGQARTGHDGSHQPTIAGRLSPMPSRAA
eukprot:scaffold15530_cov67-Isochrysis_galbana.AAC.1